MNLTTNADCVLCTFHHLFTLNIWSTLCALSSYYYRQFFFLLFIVWIQKRKHRCCPTCKWQYRFSHIDPRHRRCSHAIKISNQIHAWMYWLSRELILNWRRAQLDNSEATEWMKFKLDRVWEKRQRTYIKFHLKYPIYQSDCRRWGEGRWGDEQSGKMKLSCTYTWQCFSFTILKAFSSSSTILILRQSISISIIFTVYSITLFNQNHNGSERRCENENKW